eukprot:TRINITY_DN1259_c0_g1_i21.p1 TRINITY_DN1259_c0_g1~~TRINITY_DN1259_c0_g1_i21.p1  ORF type:complete len:103 (-),score=10.08 TRINITY_DN1259_c0_g1_i21:334-642(-)
MCIRDRFKAIGVRLLYSELLNLFFASWEIVEVRLGDRLPKQFIQLRQRVLRRLFLFRSEFLFKIPSIHVFSWRNLGLLVKSLRRSGSADVRKLNPFILLYFL